VAGSLLLAACTTIRGLIETEEALQQAGYTQVDIGFDSANGFDRVEVAVEPPFGEGRAEDEAEQAATVVWTTFPLRFDLLQIELLGPYGGDTTTYTYGEMEEILGPRPAGLDDKAMGDDLVRTGVGIALVLAVGGFLFMVAVVLAIVLGVRASRRRKATIPPPWPPVVRATGSGTDS